MHLHYSGLTCKEYLFNFILYVSHTQQQTTGVCMWEWCILRHVKVSDYCNYMEQVGISSKKNIFPPQFIAKLIINHKTLHTLRVG